VNRKQEFENIIYGKKIYLLLGNTELLLEWSVDDEEAGVFKKWKLCDFNITLK
jgi:hypothetical protein